MSDGKEQPTNTFQANIDSLFEELRLAILWERPSILFAIHRSAWRLMGARNKLQEQLHMIGCTIVELQASHEEPSIIHQILKLKPTGRTVFFVFNLNHGGEDDQNTYRALNMYRELFIENEVKVVFWMTTAEAAKLPGIAPDFWAFRHRTIEFTSGHGSPYQSAMFNLPLWYKGQAIDTQVEPGQRIRQLNQSLLQLPAEQESLAIRAQLLYDLGYAYWLAGDAEKSLELLGIGAAITDGNPIPDLHLQYLNGKAIILFQQERGKEAVEILSKLPKLEREDGITRMNLGIMLCGMGKNSEGLAQAERAVKSDPTNPDLWNRLGYVHLAAGNLEKALSHFEKAIEMLPTRPAYTESLATCHHLLGWNDRALSEIGKLRKMEPRANMLLDVFQAAFEGNPEHALEILNQLIADKKLTTLEVRRNTNLTILLDPEYLSESG
jgi:tetratricopeptide (TPR) repeat protein